MALDEHDVRAVIRGVFEVNAKLAHFVIDLHAIRTELLEEDDDGEEEEDGS
ncbi:MAG: hypothetical protein ACYDA3_01060 [Gaiellaceae bacterium]